MCVLACLSDSPPSLALSVSPSLPVCMHVCTCVCACVTLNPFTGCCCFTCTLLWLWCYSSPLIADFKREHFWNWSYFSDYCLFLLLFAGAMGIITMLFSRYPVYLESVGFMAVFTEAMLGIPQFVRNFKNKSTEGMRFVMLLAAVTQCFVCTYL